MTFCRIPNDISLHYITSTARGDTSDLDPHKPVILLIPHNLTDVTWLREQFQDPRLTSQYNLIAIDLRHMGQSKAPFNAKQDAWVDAADVAVAHEVLQLPPCHLFASGTGSCAMAMCFAMLFPEKCLSLFLCSCPIQRGDVPDWIMEDVQNLVENFCFPRDLKAFHLGCKALVGYFLSKQASIAVQNELVAWWHKHYPPRNRSSFCFAALRGFNSPRYSEKELQAIQIPTFVAHGDKSRIKSLAYARSLCDTLPNSTFLVVQGGPECSLIVPEYASVINRVFTQFLSNQSHVLARRVSPPDLKGVCKAALGRLAYFADDSDIAQRDPTTPLSFSRVSREDIDEATEFFDLYSRGEKDALNVLDERSESTVKLLEIVDDETNAEHFTMVKTHPMAAEAEIVLVESWTIFEIET